MTRSYRILAVACLTIAACSARVASVARRCTEGIAAFALAVIALVAERPNFRLVTHRLADFLNLPRRSYAGPPGGLRFESGRPTLAAHRHI